MGFSDIFHEGGLSEYVLGGPVGHRLRLKAYGSGRGFDKAVEEEAFCTVILSLPIQGDKLPRIHLALSGLLTEIERDKILIDSPDNSLTDAIKLAKSGDFSQMHGNTPVKKLGIFYQSLIDAGVKEQEATAVTKEVLAIIKNKVFAAEPTAHR